MNKLFLHKIRDCINKYRMIAEGDTVLIGVSGGIDSISLLYSLYFLKDDLKCGLVVAHVNHGLRGEQSDREADFVKGIADELKLPCIIEKIDVLKYMAEKGLSKQAAARELRYDFFERAAKKSSANKIALGHNADDQAETILMRLLRGSGAGGIAGMRAVRACSERSESNKIIRPLIEISRNEITDFAKEKGLKHVEDPSNLDTDYLRNKIRLKLIPLLKEEYNLNIIGTLKETAEILRDEDDFLDSYSSSILTDIILSKEKGLIEIDALKLKSFHTAVQRRILRIALRMIKGDLLKISVLHIEDILNLINKKASGKTLNLPDNIQVVYGYDRLQFKVQGSRFKEPPIEFNIPLAIPGETVLSEPYYKFKTDIINSKDFQEEKADKFIAFFDMDKIKGVLRVRNRVNGDIFHPSGMKGSKKLKEFFIDEKIPRIERDSIPLIVSGNTILWVVGKRVSDNGKIDKDTKCILKISTIVNNER